MQIVAFDEAGNTGPNLLDSQQPIFTLASVLVTDATATVIAEGHSELKFARLRRSNEGREHIMRVLDHGALTPDVVVLSTFHKRFMVITKIVDLLFEPLAHAGGIDLYERGGNLAMANLLYSVLPVYIDEERFNDILATFVNMVRYSSSSTITRFYRAVEASYRIAKPDHLKEELGALLASRVLVEAHPEAFHPSELDPAIPAFVQHASEWTRRLGAEFEIVHDHSKPLVNEQLILEAMMSLTDSPADIGYDRRKLRFPISATGIQFRDSSDMPALQIADMIASAAAYCMRAALARREDVFATDLLATRALSCEWFPVWPDSSVSPEDLGTEEPPPPTDPHELIGRYVSDRLGGIPPHGSRRKPGTT